MLCEEVPRLGKNVPKLWKQVSVLVMASSNAGDSNMKKRNSLSHARAYREFSKIAVTAVTRPFTD